MDGANPRGVMQILSPANGDALGLQFSAYGTCDAITPSHNPPMTVKLMDGTNVVQAQGAVSNQQNGTWEAVFSVPPGTTFTNKPSLEVECTGMTCTPVTGLTVESQSVVSIITPTPYELLQAGRAYGSGSLAAGYQLQMYVTQGGSPPPNLKLAAQKTVGDSYTVNLSLLPPGNNYVLHADVLDSNGQAALLMASGYFDVQVG